MTAWGARDGAGPPPRCPAAPPAGARLACMAWLSAFTPRPSDPRDPATQLIRTALAVIGAAALPRMPRSPLALLDIAACVLICTEHATRSGHAGTWGAGPPSGQAAWAFGLCQRLQHRWGDGASVSADHQVSTSAARQVST